MPVIANFLMIFELFLFGKSVLSICIFFFFLQNHIHHDYIIQKLSILRILYYLYKS